jgi:ABC-type transport system involved in multi-copper enzyme maturation permease subunit
MRLFLKQFFAVARLAALETVRQPIMLLVTTGCVLFIGLMPLLITHTIGEGSRLVRDSALALFVVVGLVLGAYAACATLSREIRRGTVASVLSKPVGRSGFFIAKYAGLAAVMAAFSLVALIATLLSTRTAAVNFAHDWWGVGPLLVAVPLAYLAAGVENYFLRRPFTSRAFAYVCLGAIVSLAVSAFVNSEGRHTAWGQDLPWNIVPAAALIALAILVLTGMALSLATRLDLVPTLIACSFVFLAGLMSDYLLGPAALHRPVLSAVYNLIPNWQHFWAVDALNGGAIPWSYVARAAEYASLYLAGILALGMLAFRHMEVR